MYILRGSNVTLSVDPTTAQVALTDLKTGAAFRTDAAEGLSVKSAAPSGRGVQLEIAIGENAFSACWYIDEQDAARLEVTGEGALIGEVPYPGPWIPEKGDVTLLPMQEGMAFPVDNPDIPLPPERPAYQGWFMSLQMWALVRGGAYLMPVIEDSVDAVCRDVRDDENLIRTLFSWVPEKGMWGYTRKMRVFIGEGGIVGAAKAYRRYAKEKGYVKTLREKLRSTPNIKKIIGAANCWVWCPNPKEMAAEMKANGMDKVLWSRIEQKDTIDYLKNEMGYLVGRYDMFRDVANPEIQARFSEATRNTPEIDRTYYEHCEAWPDDIAKNADGSHVKCWVIKYPDGTEIPMEAMCGARYIKYAAQDVARDAKLRGYEARFVDTLPCTALDECYDPAHPMTRTTDAYWRGQTVQYMCDMGLVTGAEDMTDYLVPHCHYSEGLMSPGFYRDSNAGYKFQRVFADDEIPDIIPDYQLNPAYRVPLFELVFHDCVVAYFYWGDSSTNYPKYMPRKDAFNALYGTLPLYGITEKAWPELKEKVFASYPRATKVHRLVGYEELVNFEYVTEDMQVQRTTFANGVTVTANFGKAPYALPDGTEILPDDYVIA